MTTFVFTDEQQELRQTMRRFLADKSPSAVVRQLMETETGYDPAVWALMAGQLGLQGMTIPDKYGGSGYGPVEQLIVCEEMGRVLLCAPYLATAVLAAGALLASGDEAAQAELLPGIADGSTIATLAVPEDDGAWTTSGLTTRASRSAGGYVLDGRKTFVLDGTIADLILVTAQADEGPALFAIDGDAPGLTRSPLQTLDMTRKQAEIELSRTPARLVGTAGAAASIVAQAARSAVIALAAEQVGGAQRCLDMSVEYAKLRVQFGRPIGSFQAIKHKCADMLLEVESARSAAYYAAWAAADNAADLPLAASLAKAYCSEAYFHAAAENIQIHGGIGFTWEHDAHLYYRRAKSSEVMLGTPAQHREIAASDLIDDVAESARDRQAAGRQRTGQ
jgi:alkylation response protein AidB-like acyl-CoA dehydrogenase